MTEEKPQTKEKKENKIKNPVVKEELKMEEQKETKKEESKEEKKSTSKKSDKKETPKVKKYEAVAYGYSLPMSKKHSMYISNAIKGKKIDDAIAYLQKVLLFKQAVPMKGEIPHRKGNMMSGRYPINASKEFITMLKGLKGNAIVNGMELEQTRITISSASWASRPARSGGRLAKRVNLIMKAREFPVKGAKK